VRAAARVDAHRVWRIDALARCSALLGLVPGLQRWGAKGEITIRTLHRTEPTTEPRDAIARLALELDARRRRLEQLAGHMSDETVLERTPSRLTRRATAYRQFCGYLREIAGDSVPADVLYVDGKRSSIDAAFRAVMRSELAADRKEELRRRYRQLCQKTGLQHRPMLPVHRAVHAVGGVIVALSAAALLACGGADTDATGPAPARAPAVGTPLPAPGGTHVPPEPAPAAGEAPAPTAPESAYQTVFFAPGSAELDPRARALLADELRWLEDNPSRHVVIHGYASDAEGQPTGNLTLSNNRANAIRDFLVGEGIAIARVHVVAHGQSGPELAATVERRAIFSAEAEPTR
jgi:peptidoglycan-associated lipoprotein